MISSIELSKIELLPNKTLAILKDNMDKEEYFSLVLKDTYNSLKDIYFKSCFVDVNSIPIYVLMLKSKNNFYKCPISFELTEEFNSLQQLSCLKHFNLFLFSDNSKIDTIKIENTNSKKLCKALLKVSKSLSKHSYNDIINAKQEILNNYSDEMLWNY